MIWSKVYIRISDGYMVLYNLRYAKFRHASKKKEELFFEGIKMEMGNKQSSWRFLKC
jgi:hypothetical protein